jgi:hypothetical protein
MLTHHVILKCALDIVVGLASIVEHAMDTNMRCAYTGKAVEGSVDAVWDDGEWISWEYINQHLQDTGQPVICSNFL